MDFQAGEFKKYRLKVKVHLGSISVDLMENTVVEFDGQTLKTGSKSYDIPALQGGVRAGWLIPEGGNISQYVPQPAGIKVGALSGKDRKAEKTIETAVMDEMEVQSVAAVNEKRKLQQEQNTYRPTAQVAPTGDPNMVEANYQLKPPTVEGSKNRPVPRTLDLPVRMPVVSSEDEAVEVSTQSIKSAAWERTGQKPVDGGVVAKLGSPVKNMKFRNIEDMVTATQAVEKTGAPATIKKTATEVDAVSVTAIHFSGATGDVGETIEGDDLSELLPDAVSSGTPRPGTVAQSPDGDTRLQWDVTGPWQNRVSRAIELYGNDKNALRQILEVETPAVAKHIRSKLARM
jgi:hypothetical protein